MCAIFQASLITLTSDASSGNHNTIIYYIDYQITCITLLVCMFTCTVHVHMPSVCACIWDKEDLLTSMDCLLGSIELRTTVLIMMSLS